MILQSLTRQNTDRGCIVSRVTALMKEEKRKDESELIQTRWHQCWSREPRYSRKYSALPCPAVKIPSMALPFWWKQQGEGPLGKHIQVQKWAAPSIPLMNHHMMKPQRLSNHIWLPCWLLGGSKSHIYGDRQNFWPNISFLNKIKVRKGGKNNWEIMGQPKTSCVSQMRSIQHCEWKVIFSWKNTWISMTFSQLFKIRSIFSLFADPVKYKPTLGEDLACVFWDILPPQRGSKIAREELDVSQAKQMAAAKGTERCRSTPGNHIFLGRGSEGPRAWWVLGTLWAHVKIQNIEHAGRT